MPSLTQNLTLDRCPQCKVSVPNLELQWQVETSDSAGNFRRFWGVYKCRKCGGLITAWNNTGFGQTISGNYPDLETVESDLPDRAREYLSQALDSAPAGAVMLAASAVDAMLKNKGYKTGSLFDRIDKAAKDHLITSEMATWAHEVRLDANDQRHDDESEPVSGTEDKMRSIEFAKALGHFLFVIPARVARGISEAQKSNSAS